MTAPSLMELADNVVLSNATGNEKLFLAAVRALLAGVREQHAAAKAEPAEDAAPEAMSDERIEMFYRGAVIRNDTTKAMINDLAQSIIAARDAQWAERKSASQEGR